MIVYPGRIGNGGDVYATVAPIEMKNCTFSSLLSNGNESRSNVNLFAVAAIDDRVNEDKGRIDGDTRVTLNSDDFAFLLSTQFDCLPLTFLIVKPSI